MQNSINNYKDLQDLLNSFVNANSLTPGGAPHGVFWETLDYTGFTTGDVPNLGVKILVIGDSANSAIIQALKGTLAGFPPMPAPSPPYNANNPSQNDVISQISAWIDAKCPN
jgi:hypothetical protein